MKTSCPICETAYTVSDEAVAGKIVKIRCTRCSAVVVADGSVTRTSASPPPAGPPRPPAVQPAGSQPIAVQPKGTQPVPTRPTPTPRRRAPRPRPPGVKLPSYRPRDRVTAGPSPSAAGAERLPFLPRVASEASKTDFEVPIEFNFDGHYDVLGVSRQASVEEVKRAAFDMFGICDRRARKGDATATQRLQKVNEAQEVLSKPDKRRRYDRESEATFLTVQDPFPYERLDWNEGLDLIRELVMTTADRDPLRDLDARIDTAERPNAILDALLGL